MELSVNVDHVATVREARKEEFPDPIHAAIEAELGGADGITVHLRGDRRHIKERDLRLLKQIVRTEVNLEIAATTEMASIAADAKPDRVTLVPEAPGEVTTQGGLDLLKLKQDLKLFISNLRNAGLRVGIFIDPDMEQIKEAVRVGAQYVEINTNEYTKASQLTLFWVAPNSLAKVGRARFKLFTEKDTTKFAILVTAKIIHFP